MKLEKFIPWKEIGKKEKNGYELDLSFRDKNISDVINYLERIKEFYGDCEIQPRNINYSSISLKLFQELSCCELKER